MTPRNILGIALALCTAMSLPVFAQDTAPRPAKVVILQSTEETVSRRYPATVLPSREIELSFKVSGQVIELPIRASSQVAAGDVIAEVDPRDFENQIRQLQSQRAQAEAQLDALRAGARAE